MRVLVTACLLSIVICGVGRAAEPGPDELIGRGLELRRQAKPQQALEMFQRAHALAPSPRTLGQMGLVEASLEHWLDAETHLAGSLAMPNDDWVRKNRTFLDQALKISRSHIGELGITGPSGTDVAVDGKHVGTLPAVQAVKLVQGNAVVTANGAGFNDFSKTVVIEGGAKTSLAIVLDPVEKRPAVALAAPVPLPSSSPPLPSKSEHRGPPWKTVTGTGLVAAGAGLLAWGIIWVSVDRNDDCPMSGAACNKVYDTKTAGWVLTAGGAALAAAGTGLLVWGRRSEGPHVAFGVTPTSLQLHGRF
jgi:hypothetical protein